MVADTLLWKDLKQTLIAIFILISIYYNFVATGSTIVTALSKALLVASLYLFLHGILPEKIFGYTVEKIHASQFHLSKDSSRDLSLSMISSWNTTVKALRSLCQGNDWSLFFKVVFVLLALSFAGAISLHSIFVLGLPIAFTAFVVYEKKEQEIDSIVLSSKSFVCKRKAEMYEKLFGSKKHD